MPEEAEASEVQEAELCTGIECLSFAKALIVLTSEPSLQAHPFPVSTPSPTQPGGPLLSSANSTCRCFLERRPGRRILVVQTWLGMTMDTRPELLNLCLTNFGHFL